ncbi:putative lipoprotein YiaD [Aliiroseovarius sp. xm-m-379]|uniref:OmpA family protein n=1 Tax=Aliiroseovarius crassostreae TaxID=154981 RepID=A0A9Q9HAF7_9RHOB|nr:MULTISPECIES: OmpA family protein [Aliiroseovarius]NRP14217.1 putative lipoprotein YiaD [Aliiroseovarius sp. xm-d-517]NRP23701.1 putative lipoprotein YiaD [Aliiroseovarius sp. xm-m-379]NRP29052.1 putative lipoprotein YiaD [Aliiroseovarius sp. xm-m-314]NRP32500.1 putative lipoprotein YiaD [Aliiroseovarius sp. xm-a-104]NRP41033.1 putative lipoprotein YiaD [Aliiroseovarius sp. xm-m-339-2]
MFQTKPLLILGTIGALSITACTSPTGEMGPRTKDGAVAGAMVGGLIGAISGDDNKLGSAALGAAIGAGVGGVIGSQLDKQARELEASMGNDQVRIVNTGESLVVTMPQDILFATDSAVVNPGLRSDLGALARNLLNYPNSAVEVIGHTDNVGDAGYNLALSQRRAASVASVLFQNGVPSSRVVTIGRGESRPVASNLTPEGRQQNRRVEIIIRPYT